MKIKSIVFLLLSFLAGPGISECLSFQQFGAGKAFNFFTNSNKKSAWLGVSIRDFTSKDAKKMNVKIEEGALITDVQKKSPADSAGLLENDVIIEFNERQIYDADDLQKSISKVKPGTKVNILFYRKNEKKSIPVTIGKYPKQKSGAIAHLSQVPNVFSAYSFSGSGKLGMELMDLNDQLCEYFGIQEGKGVLIKNVEKKSSAEKSGFKAGDVILKIDKEEISDVNDVFESISDLDEGEKVEFEIMRKGTKNNIIVEIENSENEYLNQLEFNVNPHVKILKNRGRKINIEVDKMNDQFKKGIHIYLKNLKDLDHLSELECLEDINIDVNLDDLKMELEKLKPELEKMSPDNEKMKKELEKIKPEINKLKKELKKNLKYDIKIDDGTYI